MKWNNQIFIRILGIYTLIFLSGLFGYVPVSVLYIVFEMRLFIRRFMKKKRELKQLEDSRQKKVQECGIDNIESLIEREKRLKSDNIFLRMAGVLILLYWAGTPSRQITMFVVACVTYAIFEIMRLVDRKKSEDTFK